MKTASGSRAKTTAIYAFMITAFFLSMLVSMRFGAVDLSVGDIAGALANGPGSTEHTIFYKVRLPRVMLGAVAGAGLAMVGAVMQGIFSNPLADPGIIGVSSGAATGAVLSIALGWATESMFVMPAFAFCGSVCAVALTVFLAMRNGKIPVMTLLLAGVAVGMLLGAVTSGLLTFMNEQKLQQYLFWMVGGLDYRRWEHVYMAIGPVSIGIVIMLALSRHLNILVLGETEARAVGMPVGFYRFFLLAVASLTTAAGVCISGNIGFVGLVVPHMMRLLTGPDHQRLLPASMLAGAAFLVFCDAFGRFLLPTVEIRAGIMTAFIGTPYFLYLLRKSRSLHQD